MSVRRPRAIARFGFGLAFAVSGLVLSTAPAQAACGLTAEAVDGAPLAFVGSLVDVGSGGSTGTFEVEDVWKGESLDAGELVTVEVDAGGVFGLFELPPEGTPVQFLVLAALRDDGRLRTGASCSLFPFPWSTDYLEFRPVDAPAAGDQALGIAHLALMVAALAGVVLLFGLALRGRPGIP
ncbi:MAG TPA: hypothetical protein VFP83_05955 [Candidatus Limnocylindria bacterium]|nr:hypothetical protein [Candidatus Limnocylindria bacterium]